MCRRHPHSLGDEMYAVPDRQVGLCSRENPPGANSCVGILFFFFAHICIRATPENMVLAFSSCLPMHSALSRTCLCSPALARAHRFPTLCAFRLSTNASLIVPPTLMRLRTAPKRAQPLPNARPSEALCSLPLPLLSSPHLRAALAIRTRRIRDPGDPMYNISRHAQACATTCVTSHPTNLPALSCP